MIALFTTLGSTTVKVSTLLEVRSESLAVNWRSYCPGLLKTTVVTGLLLLQMAGLSVLAFLSLHSLVSLAFIALAVLALGAAVGFARLRRGGWVNAVLASSSASAVVPG